MLLAAGGKGVEQRLSKRFTAEGPDRLLGFRPGQPCRELLRQPGLDARMPRRVDRNDAVGIEQFRVLVLGDRRAAEEDAEVRQVLACRQERAPVREGVGLQLIGGDPGKTRG